MSLFLKDLTTDTNECAGDLTNGICTRNPILISAIIDIAENNEEISGSAEANFDKSKFAEADDKSENSAPLPSIVQKAAAVLGCGSESCILKRLKQPQKIMGHSAENAKVIASAAQHELELNFKPPGPRNHTGLLSNVNIDSVLHQWSQKEFNDFYPCPFSMADFNTNGDLFGAIDVSELRAKNPPWRTFGCVHNTDTSRGPGTHWVAVFVDMREWPWSVEYFNSSGRPPATAMVRWMERTRMQLINRLGKSVYGFADTDNENHSENTRENHSEKTVFTVAVTSVMHQQSQTECGPYSLYYIRRRLEGAPYTDFMTSKFRIPDAAMVEFRRHMFREM